MYIYKIYFKSGHLTEVESKWLSIDTVCGMLCDHQPFIHIADKVIAKDDIAFIQKIETTEE